MQGLTGCDVCSHRGRTGEWWYKIHIITRRQFSSHVLSPHTPITTQHHYVRHIHCSAWTNHPSLPILEVFGGAHKHTLMLSKCSEENVLTYSPATALTNLENADWLLFQLNCIASICTGTQTCTQTHRHTHWSQNPSAPIAPLPNVHKRV